MLMPVEARADALSDRVDPARPGQPAAWDRRTVLILAGLTMVGLALRIACARGGLWLDEAWSVILAHEVGTPAGIFLGINHDNNHHLNSLWLLLVGKDAAPLTQRALSIAMGTLAIPVAATFVRRLGRGPMLVTATLFAITPILVTLGSEARGYAPMVLAWLAAAVQVDRALADEAGPHARRRLALAVLFGGLSQLTMIFGLIALGGWAFFTWAARAGIGTAARRSLHFFAPALVAQIGIVALVAGAAWASTTGWQFGSYVGFSGVLWLHALIELFGYTVGVPVVSIALALVPVALVGLGRRLEVQRLGLYRLTILAFPIAMALLRTGNPGHPRYYLFAALGPLLLLGEAIGRALADRGHRRVVGALALVGIVAGSIVQDLDLATNLRGDPAIAIRVLQGRSPGGAVVLLDRSTAHAMMEVAAAHAHYPLRLLDMTCPTASPPPRFALADRFKGEALPPVLPRCGVVYRPIASRLAHGLSGTHWTLYERVP